MCRNPFIHVFNVPKWIVSYTLHGTTILGMTLRRHLCCLSAEMYKICHRRRQTWHRRDAQWHHKRKKYTLAMSGHVMGLVGLAGYLPDDEMTPLAASWPGRVCEDIAIVTRSLIFIFTITYEEEKIMIIELIKNNNDNNDNTVKAV